MTSLLFKPDFLMSKPARYRASDDFLCPMVAQEVEEKLKDHARSFKKIAIISPAHLHWDIDGDRYVPKSDLGMPAGAYDLVLHLHGLHADNDVVGQMIQARMALAPDGVFIAAFLGGETLSELRASMMQAEIETQDGASQRVAPMIDLRDAGGLLSRAGFALPVADNWPLKVQYACVRALMHDLRKLGLSNPLNENLRNIDRAFYHAIERHYPYVEGCEAPTIEASFELIFLTAHAPSKDQPKPLKPGSVTFPLREAIKKANENDDT